MTRAGLSLIFFVFIASACVDNERPQGVLSKQEYAAFLVEVYLAEARLSTLPIISDSAMRLYLAHEPELLARSGLTDSTIRVTYQYYLGRPKELEEVYAAVVDTLSLREQKASTP